MTDKKHIVFLAQFAGTPDYGMVYGHYYLAREWVRQGHKVTIVSAVPSHTRFRQPDCPNPVTEEIIDGVRFLWMRCVKYSHSNWVLRILNILHFVFLARFRRLPIEGADVVICSSHQPLAIVAAEKMASRFKARLVFEVRDLWPLSLMEMSGASRFNPFIMLLQWAENRAYRKAGSVVSVLPYSKAYMTEHGMAPEKFNYIPNGVDIEGLEAVDPLPAEHEEILSRVSELDFCIGYAGNIGYANALDALVKALAELPDNVKFFIVGKGPVQAQLSELARASGVEDKLCFLPSIRKTEVQSFLARMDALYIGLHHKDIFKYGVSPTKINDYLLASKPVIYAVNVPHAAIEEGGAGVHCEAESPDSVVKAVGQLLAMTEEERQAMGKQGNAWIRSHRDYRVLADNFLEVIEATPKY